MKCKFLGKIKEKYFGRMRNRIQDLFWNISIVRCSVTELSKLISSLVILTHSSLKTNL